MNLSRRQHWFREIETFDQSVSNKIHKNLVTRTLLSKDKSLILARPTSVSKQSMAHPSLTNDVIVDAINAKADTVPKVNTLAIPQEANNNSIIVSGTREKQRFSELTRKKCGSGYPDSIVTRKRGKLENCMLVLHSTRMRPSKD